MYYRIPALELSLSVPLVLQAVFRRAGARGLIYDFLLLSCGIRLLMFQPCFDRILICLIFYLIFDLDILHTPLRSARCFSRRHRRALEKQGQKKQTKHSKQQDNTSMTVTVLVPGIRLFNFGNYCFNSSINFCD